MLEPKDFIVTDASKLAEVSKAVSGEDISAVESMIRKKLEEIPHAAAVAAVQVGVPVRVFGWRFDDTLFINPVITSLTEPFIFGGEGCLSFPGEYINTKRFNRVVVEAKGLPPKEYTGLQAVVIQHELDHMDGKTMHGHRVVKPGRNEKCPCGSGKKAKTCCLDKFVTEQKPSAARGA